MRKTGTFILLIVCLFLMACTTGKTIAKQSDAKGVGQMTRMNDTFPRDEGGSINPSFYISHAQSLSNPIWRAYIDGTPYTMTFSNLSRKWINVYIYKGDKVDRTQTIFEGDAEMEELNVFGHVVQITSYEKGKHFLPGFGYMVVKRDGYGVVHITMQQHSYTSLHPGVVLDKATEMITGNAKNNKIDWEFIQEKNPDELQYLTITRSQPAGTGIEYVATVEPEGLVKQTINTVNYKNPNLPGSSGEHKWRWQALKDGFVTITISELGLHPTENHSTVQHYEIKNGMFNLLETPPSPSLQPSKPNATFSQPTWTCSSCGTKNDNKFCTECGRPRP